MKAFLTEAYHRFNAETPTFFKKFVRGGLTIGSAGAGLKTLAASGVVLPHLLVVHVDYMIAVGAVTALVAKLACKAPENLPTNQTADSNTPQS